MLCCWALESVLSYPVPYRAHLQLELVAPAIVLWPIAVKCNSNCGLNICGSNCSPKKIIPYCLSQLLFSTAEGLYPPGLPDLVHVSHSWMTCSVTSVRSTLWSWSCLYLASPPRCPDVSQAHWAVVSLPLHSQSRSTAAISVLAAWSAWSLSPCSSVTWLLGMWVSTWHPFTRFSTQAAVPCSSPDI